MGIVEAKGPDNFLEWVDAKNFSRYMVIVTEEKEMIYKPVVSTPGLDTVLVGGLSEKDIGTIKDKLKKMAEETEIKPIEIKECLRYHFDERKDPRKLSSKEE